MKKLAIVTGATSGIGQATARKLASIGYDLVVTGRRGDRLQQTADSIAAEFGAEVRTLCFDIRDNSRCEEMFGSLPEERPIDLLVNNAGLAAGLEHIDCGATDDWNAMIDTNIKGLLYATRIISKRMVRQGFGHIVMLGSIAGTQPYENGAVYCATKHAVHAISQSIRADLVGHGIRVSEIRPGMVETEFSVVRFHGDQRRADDVYRDITPLSGEDIADIIEWVVSRPPHVNIDDILVTPQQQASAYLTCRSGKNIQEKTP